MTTNDPAAEKIWTLLGEFDTAVLVTVDEETTIRARPMAIAGIENGRKIWFITAADTAKLHEISEHTRVGVVCQKGHSLFLSLSGDAMLICDREKVAELWKESFRIWFPDGKDDPKIVLIAVQPSRAEYWDNSGLQGVQYLWDAATAYVTGTTPKSREGEQHGVVTDAEKTLGFR